MENYWELLLMGAEFVLQDEKSSERMVVMVAQ